MATKEVKKKRSLSYSVPAKDNDLYLRALSVEAALMFPSEDDSHGPRSKLINYLIFKHLNAKGYCDDRKVFKTDAIEKAEVAAKELKSKPKIS